MRVRRVRATQASARHAGVGLNRTQRGCGGVKPPLHQSGPAPRQPLDKTLTRSRNPLKLQAWPPVSPWADRKGYPG